MTLHEFNYNGFDDDVENYLNPDGSKKKWPHKRKQEPQYIIDTRNILTKELNKYENQLKALKAKIKNTKDDRQKYVMTNTRQPKLIAKINKIKSEINKLN